MFHTFFFESGYDVLLTHRPDRYVPLFGAAAYDYSNEYDATPFEEQLEAMTELIKQGKVRKLNLRCSLLGTRPRLTT
jgi:aryl-alcohol dehydrogenase-like predicted oxidoreductase